MERCWFDSMMHHFVAHVGRWILSRYVGPSSQLHGWIPDLHVNERRRSVSASLTSTRQPSRSSRLWSRLINPSRNSSAASLTRRSGSLAAYSYPVATEATEAQVRNSMTLGNGVNLRPECHQLRTDRVGAKLTTNLCLQLLK